MIAASSASFKCSTLKCQSRRSASDGKHLDPTGCSRYADGVAQGPSNAFLCISLASCQRPFFGKPKKKNSFHAAAGMVWSTDPLPAFQCCFAHLLGFFPLAAEHWRGCSCCCRYPVQGYSASLPIFFGPSPQLLWIILWISGQKKVNAQIQEPDQDLLQPATAMAPSSFGKAPSDSQSEHVLGPLLSMDISKVCLLRSVAWTFL